MKRGRPFTRLLLCLLLGAATAITIAWALAYFNNTLMLAAPGRVVYPQHRIPWQGDELYICYIQAPGRSLLQVGAGWTPDQLARAALQESFPPIDKIPEKSFELWPHPPYPLPSWGVLPDRTDPCSNIDTTAFGWPARCLCGSEFTYIGGITYNAAAGRNTYTNVRHPTRGFINFPASTAGRGGILLPLLPIPTGLILDSIFFSAAWLALWLLITTLRRARRRSFNLCPTCAYDLRATPANSPCPECGHATSKSRSTRIPPIISP